MARHLSTYLNNSRCVIIEMLETRGYDVSTLKSFNPAPKTSTTMDPIKLSKEDECIEIHYDVSSTRTNHKKITNAVKAVIESRDVKDKDKNNHR